MSDRTFVCIVCPNGCPIRTCFEGDRVLDIQGHQCARGREYVIQELTDPRRTIATSVPIVGGDLPLVSVRLTKPIPKKDIFAVMERIGKLQLHAPVTIGQVVLADVFGLHSDVIVTKNVDRTGEG